MERALNVVVPGLVAEGAFGTAEFRGLERDEDTEKGPQFASDIAFVTLRLAGQNDIPLVVKVQTDIRWVQDNLDMKGQFENEITMYRDILPALGTDHSWYPKFYHGSCGESSLEEDVVILRNMKGYRKSVTSPFLDFPHMSLAMKKIAAFHSRSYAYKHEQRDHFAELAKKLKWLDKNEIGMHDGHVVSLKRSAGAFERKYGRHGIMEELLKVFSDGLHFRAMTEADEPLFGVICHGDYCNNNIIYKYDESGRPVECAFFDFQLSLYGTPATDLAFYLYMHTTTETREKHWDDLLKIYWTTLRETVPQNVAIPSYEEFSEHFASRAVYGYVLCSNFLPFLLSEDDFGELGNLTREEQLKIEETRGGELGEIVIRDALHHAFERKYIHAFLDFMKKRGSKR